VAETTLTDWDLENRKTDQEENEEIVIFCHGTQAHYNAGDKRSTRCYKEENRPLLYRKSALTWSGMLSRTQLNRTALRILRKMN
jgi:hypothetical protein